MKDNCVIAIAKALLIQVFWSALCSNQIPSFTRARPLADAPTTRRPWLGEVGADQR